MTMNIDSSTNKLRRTEDSLAVLEPRTATSWRYRVSASLLELPRYAKRCILLVSDYLISCLCLFLALSLRFGTVESHISMMLLSLCALAPVLGLYMIGFYKGVTRIFFDGEMRSVLQLFVLLLVAIGMIHYLDSLRAIPRSVPAMYLFLFFIWLWSSRLTLRELLASGQGQREFRGNRAERCEKVIIYGAGAAGKALYEALRHTSRYQVIAFVDDDSRLTGAHLFNKRIYAPLDLPALVVKFNIEQVFLAVPTMGRARTRQIIDTLSNISVKIKKLPSLTEIADGKVTVSTLRQVDILDVLNRQTAAPNAELLRQNISNKGVVVTGAGGSIGSELCRQILKNRPRCLVLFELSEYALYAIHQELLAQQATLPLDERSEIVALIGNVTNEHKLQTVFATHHIQTVYHAAAYKHVPIVEQNPFEGVINNAKGTYHCARAAIRAQVTTFVLISTDKAVRPTNIMGASKRLAELVCQALSWEVNKSDNALGNHRTSISMVRFGNVLGSSGSVVPLFTRQIEHGGPITVTHPEVTQYFMTIPEAANLVIQAGAMAKGGEVFVLDMGHSVKIVDLARRMVHLSGCQIKDEANPHGDIEIVFTGLRPGEKLYEELIIGEDNIASTKHPLIKQAREHCFALPDIEETLEQLVQRAQQDDISWLKQQFRYFVSGYQQATEVKKPSAAIATTELI